MSMSPAQMRKKSLAMDESERNARYAQADGCFRKYPEQQYYTSKAIQAEGKRVNAATAKEDKDIGPYDMSPNASIRF